MTNLKHITNPILMRKYVLFIIFFYSFNLSINASTGDSITTIYKKGEFVTYCKLSVNASDSISHKVIDKFVYQMCYNLDELFKWGLKGMSLTNSKDELIKFDFKTTKYNKNTRVLSGIGDIIVPGITTIPNIYIDNKLIHLKYTNEREDVKLDLVSENPFIKNMNSVFTFIPRGRNKMAYYTLETKIQFNWFFNVFITQNRYKKIMEWRLKKLVQNIKDESEKYEKKEPLITKGA